MNKTITKQFLLPFILVTSLFFLWGLANNMTDTLLAAFKKIMSKTDFETSWVQFAFYGSYFCLAIPAAIFIKKYSYKTGIILGLSLFAAGALLFYPASQTMVYGHFLMALFILAGGLSILETTANPYIIAMGDPETAGRGPIGTLKGLHMPARVQHHDRKRFEPHLLPLGHRLADHGAGLVCGNFCHGFDPLVVAL